MISQVNTAVMEQLRKDHPKATDADLEQLANAKVASNTKAILTGVPNADDVKFDDAVAEKGKKIILTSVRQGAELTREVFLFIRSCKGVDYVEGTFKVAEARAIKALRDGQPENEKPIKTLADIAKIQGGAGASSYIAVRSRLTKILRESEELVENLQKWYNFQAKYDKEPQMFVQPDFLDPWGKRYEDEKRGWSVYTRDARLAEQCAVQLKQRQDSMERAKGKEAAAQTGQNGEAQNQGMASGTRQRGNLAESTQQCLNAVIKTVHDVAEELPQDVVNGALSLCVATLQAHLAAKREQIKAAVAQTSSQPSPGIAEADTAARASLDEGTERQADLSVLPEPDTQDGSTDGALSRPEWLREEDWNAATAEERQIMLNDKEAYLEELELMGKGEEIADTGSNEPDTPAEVKAQG